MLNLPALRRVKLDWAIAVILALAAGLYLCPFLANGVFLDADEGIVLQGAARILRGQVLYQDFFSFYTPASFYWMALLFKLFGTSVLVGRAVLLVYGGLFSALTYLLARRFCSRVTAGFVTYLLLVCCLPLRFFVLHNWDSTASALLTLYCTICLLEVPKAFWAFATGFFTSLTFLFEQSKGGGLLLGLGLGMLILSRIRPGGIPLSGRHWGLVATGLALPLAFTVLYFASQHAFKAMLAAWVWPLHHYSAANKLGYGFLTVSAETWKELYVDSPWGPRLLNIFVTSPALIVSVLPLLLIGVAGARAAQGRREASSRESDLIVMSGAVLVGLLAGTWMTGRLELHHLTYLTPLFLFLLPLILDIKAPQLNTMAAVRPVAVVYLLLSFTAFGLALLWGPLHARQLLQTRRGVLRVPRAEVALSYVEEHVAPGSSVLVHPYQPLYSFLTGTFNPTRYEYLQAGMHTPAQFGEAVAQLAADKTKVVLLNPNFTSKIATAWPSTPAEALAHDPITDYIFAHYRVCKVLRSENWPSWPFLYMVRSDFECPR